MESVKRLRKYANGPCVYKDQKRVLLEIAEAFEVEHAEAYAKAYDDGYDEGFASADDWLADHEDELAEHGYTKLPKDADGEVIHVGDDMERGDAHGRVIALMLSNYPKGWGGGLHWSIQLEGEKTPTALDLTFHHYRKPTVEDVLREFAKRWDDPAHYAKGELVETFAEKLQLKED